MGRRSDSSSPTARRTSHRRTLLRWMPLVAAIIVGVAAAAAVISLGRVADDNRRAQLSLAVFMERVHETSAIEWQAAAQRRVSPGQRREVDTLHRQMKASLAQALQLDPHQTELRRLPALHQRYMTAVEEEFRLLAAGKIAEARVVDNDVIDPSFETLEEAVHEADKVNNTLAEQRIRTSQTAAVLTLIAGLVIIGALLWRFDRVEHAARMSELERDLLRESEEKLRSLSLRDDLTGLHNRRGFFALAQQQMKVTARSDGELFLVFADLDGLKSINDTMGHGAGDEALREAADVLRRTFRSSDIFSRMGGDEFAVLGEQRAKLPVGLMLARLQENLDQRNARDDAGYRLELSVGVVTVKAAPGTNIDDVLTTADKRMYAQKRGKRKSA